MTITINDLKLFESENMTNFSDGGGAMSSNVIIDGASNNIFPDVTEQDRTYGHVHERKVFMGITSQNNDATYSAMSYISKLPLDEKINVNLYKSKAWFDQKGNREIKEKTQTSSVQLTPASTVTNTTIGVTHTLSAVNTIHGRSLFAPAYNISSNASKAFNAFLSGYDGSATIPAGQDYINIFGYDGIQTPIGYTGSSSDYCYGIAGLTSTFLNNFFYLKDATKQEKIKVIGVIFNDYHSIYPSDSGFTAAHYLKDETGAGSTDGATLTTAPLRRFEIKLILAAPLVNSFNIGVNFAPSGWLSAPVKLLTVDSEGATTDTIIPATYKVTQFTDKKFYSAKRITASATSGQNAIAIPNNTNKVIPELNGLVLEAEILGTNPVDFVSLGDIVATTQYLQAGLSSVIAYYGGTIPDTPFRKITTAGLANGYYKMLMDTVVFNRADIAKIEVTDKNGSVVSPSKYSVNYATGEVVFTDFTGFEQPTTIRVTPYMMSAGSVPTFSGGDIIIIFNDKETTGTYLNSETVTLTRTNLSKVTIRDSANNLVDTSKFTVNLNTGTVTFTNVSGLSQPLTITDRIEDLGLIVNVTTNAITLQNPLTHSYPIDGTIVSNCMLHGTLQSAATKPFDQQTWTNVWQSTAIGSTVSAQYNDTNYPIVTTNHSAITERWLVIFVTATTFNLIGEHLGQIVTNASTATDLAPINPHTSLPYFVMAGAGFGANWVAGNAIRFDTYAAAAPFWILQSVAQGQATNANFDFAIEVRGEIDAA